MKKRILLFTATAVMAVIVLTSGQNGAGAESGYDATGAETGLMNPAGCSESGASCHGTAGAPATGITVTVELDSAGYPITHYSGGGTYTVKITGTNTTASVLPRFGFQVSCIKGATAQVTPVNAGTFPTSGLPTGVRHTSARSGFFVCNVIEHSTPILASSGTGGSGTTYTESFSWTAPVAGTGAISFWAALNAVNFDGSASAADKWNTAHITITEHTAAVANVSNDIGIKAFPNPVINTLNLQFENAPSGSYSLHVFDMSGRSMSNENIEANGISQTTINTSNWAPGMYQVVVEKDGNRQVIAVVKQ